MRPGDEAALAEQARAVLAAREEWRRREAARRSPSGWFEYGPPTEKGSPKLERWQRHALSELEALLREWVDQPPGPRSVWIVNVDAPPQSGKSELAKRLLAWVVAELGMSVGYVSYAASLALSHSVAIRSLLRSPEAKRAWPWIDGSVGRDDEVIKDTEAEWKIASPTPDRRGARMTACGRDGSLTGKVMDLVGLDDMFKDAGDYSSAASRREVDLFLRSAVIARLMERGGIVLNVGTRWGLQDTRAWFDERIEEMRAAGVEVRVVNLSYPLKAREGDVMGREPGEYLTDRWSPAKEAAARIFYGRHAPAILDCAPTPDGGVKFKREWFSRRYVGHPDAVAKLCDVRALVVDPASTSGDGDYSSIEHWGWSGVKMRKLHKHRGQWAYNELEAAIVDAMAAYRPSALLVENTSNGRAIVSRLQLRFPNLIPMSHLGRSKAVRWDAQSPVFYAGNVEFPDPQFAPWMLGYVERMVLLTGEVDGEVDDEADTWEMAARWRAEAQTQTVDPAAYLRVLQGMR
jgi:phage terminase large subunit-like protein